MRRAVPFGEKTVKIILAPIDQQEVVQQEVGEFTLAREERLFLCEDRAQSYFAQNIWEDVQKFEFKSISEANNHLRKIQRNWWLHAVAAFRRAQLIHEQLPPLRARALTFPSLVPTAPLGSWTLWDENTMYYSAKCSSPFPDGEVHFVENRSDPPSRAYLKLWEYFTLEQSMPKPGDRVLDLGSSPGGWTWVLDQLGCEVISVDKAPLSDKMKISNRVRYVEESAFSLEPKMVGPVDWLFSDIICYPDRLLQLVRKWMDAGVVKNFVCTIKFQGPANYRDVVREFMAFPNSRVRHLFNNKHELTWSARRDER